MELLEFKLNGFSYGVELSSVREIMSYQDLTIIPNAHPSVEGVFMPRDKTLVVVDLKNVFQMESSYDNKASSFVVANLNCSDIAFHVDDILGIHNLTERDIIDTPSIIASNSMNAISNVIKLDNRIVLIVDLSKIIYDINPIEFSA